MKIKYKTFRKSLSILCVCLFFVSLLGFVSMIAAGGILSDMDQVLIEVRELEEQGLLDNPPAETRSIVKNEIKVLKNSKGVEDYIKSIESSQGALNKWIYAFMCFFALTFILRLFVKPLYRFLGGCNQA